MTHTLTGAVLGLVVAAVVTITVPIIVPAWYLLGLFGLLGAAIGAFMGDL